jgi:AsmA protein
MGRTVGHWKPLVLENVNLEMRDFSSTTPFTLALDAKVRGGGSVKLNGKAGPIDPADSAMTPATVTMNLAQLDLAGSGMNDFAPDLSGVVSFDGSGESNGTLMTLKGKMKAEKLVLAKGGKAAGRVVELDLALQHDLRKHTGILQQGDVHIGRAVAHLTGNYAEKGESMTLAMKLAGPSMPVEELEAMLPPMAIVLPAGSSLKGGTASVNVTIEGPADHAVVAGTLSLDKTTLAGFDLPKKMASIEKLAGIKGGPDAEIEKLGATVRMAPDGTEAKNIALVVPSIGELTGEGTVSPANALNFKMAAVVHTSGLLAAIGNKPIPFSVEGTASDPVFKPDMKAVAKEEVKGLAGGLLRGLTGKKN